jgi:hypothetical protein
MRYTESENKQNLLSRFLNNKAGALSKTYLHILQDFYGEDLARLCFIETIEQAFQRSWPDDRSGCRSNTDVSLFSVVEGRYGVGAPNRFPLLDAGEGRSIAESLTPLEVVLDSTYTLYNDPSEGDQLPFYIRTLGVSRRHAYRKAGMLERVSGNMFTGLRDVDHRQRTVVFDNLYDVIESSPDGLGQDAYERALSWHPETEQLEASIERLERSAEASAERRRNLQDSPPTNA